MHSAKHQYLKMSPLEETKKYISGYTDVVNMMQAPSMSVRVVVWSVMCDTSSHSQMFGPNMTPGAAAAGGGRFYDNTGGQWPGLARPRVTHQLQHGPRHHPWQTTNNRYNFNCAWASLRVTVTSSSVLHLLLLGHIHTGIKSVAIDIENCKSI